MPERYWLTFTTRRRHGPPTQQVVYYQREGPDRWRLYHGKAGRTRSVASESSRQVEYQVDLARHEGRFLRHEPDQGRMFNNPTLRRAPAMRNPRVRTYALERRRRRRRNPSHADWLDLLLPVVFLYLLVRGGRIQVDN